jgi:hypothetical protein
MNWKKVILIFLACQLITLLSGCQTAVQSTIPPPQPSETSLLPTNTLVPASVTPIPTSASEPSPTIVPTDTSVPPTPTITAIPEQRVTSIDQLIGVWRGKWDTYYLEEYTSNGEAIVVIEQYIETAEKELFTFEDGILTWGEITFTIGEPQECLDDPVASYEVYITYQGDQPVSLRWVLVGEEHCQPRYKFLTLFPYTWYGTALP